MDIGFELVSNNNLIDMPFGAFSPSMVEAGAGLANFHTGYEDNLNSFNRTNFYNNMPAQNVYNEFIQRTNAEIFSAYDYVQKNVVQNALNSNYTPQQAMIIKNAYSAYMPNSFV